PGPSLPYARAIYLVGGGPVMATAPAIRTRNGTEHDDVDEPHPRILLAILAGSVISTVIHYTHNIIAIDHYPQSSRFALSDGEGRAFVATGWVVLTAFGALGYCLYRRGSYRWARVCLSIYSVAGFVTLGH